MNLIDKVEYQKYLSNLNEKDVAILNSKYNYYTVSFESVGGLVMPLILQFTFTDGSKEVVRIPAEIWKMNDKNVSKVFFFEKELAGIELDPFLETADVDLSNNNWPPKMQPSKFELYERKAYNWGGYGENPMQRAKKNEELKNKQ